MRLLVALSLASSLLACGPSRGDGDGTDANTGPKDACIGLQCRVVNCAKQGKPETTLTGTVYAPNGTLALYGATVYVPNLDPGPFPDGVQCQRCESQLPGEPITHTMSDTAGQFTLSNVPSGTDIPLFITIGKWRRKVLIPAVQECTDNQLPSTLTSLPKNKSEGDIPKIAIATGSCDALECLLRKIGIGDSEFTSDTGNGRVHLYTANGANRLASTNETLPSSQTLVGNLDKLKEYDIAMFSCECSQAAAQKLQEHMDNLKAYADVGGRVFLTHYASVWIGGERNNPNKRPAVWPTIGACDADGYAAATGIIDQVNNPKGSAFAQWMVNVQGSTTPGSIGSLQDPRQTCSSIDNAKAERWVFAPIGATEFPQVFQFTTPNEIMKDDRCGKVVMSDMHVASGSSSSGAFPGGCSSAPMTPQEKALAFMFFDIASCVGIIL
jgi:hypothetical protein